MNLWIFELINGWAGRNAGLDAIMVFAATNLLYLVGAVVAVLAARALYHRRWKPVLQTGSALALACALNFVVGGLNHEARPFQDHQVVQLIPHEPSVSLPSDHATAAFALALAAIVFLHRWWGAGLLVASAAIGFSRVWVGVHYPGDVLASLGIALFAVAAVLLVDRLRARRQSASAQLPSADVADSVSESR